MNRRLFNLFFVTLFAVTEAFAFNPLPDATPEKLVGGAENLELVTTAKELKVYRIVDPEQRPKPKKTITLDGYLCHATPATVGEPELQQVITALSDVTNFGGALMCIFDPGIILRFEADKRTLDFVICFSCREMVLYRDGTVVKRPDFKFASTKNTFLKDARRAFTAVAKKAFPNDKAIQSLKQ